MEHGTDAAMLPQKIFALIGRTHRSGESNRNMT
jgi:hypothetical protein